MKRLLTAVCLGLLLGCSTAPKDPPINTIKPLDAGVVATVKMNLKTDAELAAANLTVQAENDLLVLRGEVPSEEAKAKAEAIARKVDRVKKVANHIEVTAASE